MVATAAEEASQVGVDVLRRGGNAVDAAIATHFALAVAHPTAGNIGGGGFMVLRMADGTRAALDFRERAPGLSTRDMFLDDQGNVAGSTLGHLSVGVPGSVMGMWQAHRRFGTLPWADLVGPAIDLAEGFEVRPHLARSLRSVQARLRMFDTSAEVFLPGGEAPAAGDILRQPDLAATLGRISEQGASGFYHGETAELLVAEMERGGGVISLEDLARYTAVWRDPVVFDYRDHTVISMHPPSSGGATIAQIANILEGYDLQAMGFQTPATVHVYTEASKRAFADRNTYLGDPDFVSMPLDQLISKEYAMARRATIRPDRATPSTEIRPGLGAAIEGDHTTHYSVVDGMGGAVSVTTTLNSGYGSKVTVAGAGFLLNNEMDNFAAKPGRPNQYGLVQGEANAVAPGKRMLSSMSPSVVLDPNGRLFFVTGSPGGPTIISTVFQTVSNVIDFHMNVVDAVHAPRLHHQHLPDRLGFERNGLTPETVAALEELGHTLASRGGYQGDVNAIMVMPDGTLQGASDPRRSGGKAIGYR